MGLFKKLIDKFNQGFFYVVDINVLKDFFNTSIAIDREHNLETYEQLFIYYKNEKHEIKVIDYSYSDIIEEKTKGLVFCYDGFEYKSLEEFFDNAVIANTKLNDITDYFKIEIMDHDFVPLNNWMKEHPELRVEDYN